MSRSLKDDAREIVVVVLGILIAFSLEGWREQREEDARFRQHLEALDEDFSENLRAIRSTIETVETRRDAVEALRAQFKSPPIDISRDSAMVLMGLAFGVHRHPSTEKAYDELVSTGGLGTLESPVLRATLGAWATELSDVRRVESDNFNHRDWIAMGYLTENVAWAEAARQIPGLGHNVGPSRFSNDLEALAADRGLDNLLATRVVMMSDALVRYAALEQRTTDVLRALSR